MQFSVSGSERQACVPLMRGNTVKNLSLGSPYWRGGDCCRSTLVYKHAHYGTTGGTRFLLYKTEQERLKWFGEGGQMAKQIKALATLWGGGT